MPGVTCRVKMRVLLNPPTETVSCSEPVFGPSTRSQVATPVESVRTTPPGPLQAPSGGAPGFAASATKMPTFGTGTPDCAPLSAVTRTTIAPGSTDPAEPESVAPSTGDSSSTSGGAAAPPFGRRTNDVVTTKLTVPPDEVAVTVAGSNE